MTKEEWKDLVAFCVPFIGIVKMPCHENGWPIFDNEFRPRPHYEASYLTAEWCGVGLTIMRVGKVKVSK